MILIILIKSIASSPLTDYIDQSMYLNLLFRFIFECVTLYIFSVLDLFVLFKALFLSDVFKMIAVCVLFLY